MGTFNDLLNRKPNFQELAKSRKKLIKKIQDETGRKLLIYVSDINFKGDHRDSMIVDEDRPAFIDLIESIKEGENVDLLIETPGGRIEIVEDFVYMLRKRFKRVRFIVPNIAKSAGTIMVMSGDEILMDYTSTLGPIDAQITSRGKSFAAQAFLEGLKKIVKEAEEKNMLERAYIPILQNVSPAEIQACEDADLLSKTLVTEWLENYMFADRPDAKSKAKSVAAALCKHDRWLSHGRSIRIDDLIGWDFKIIDISKYKKLHKYIRDLWLHVFWTFRSNIFKFFESEKINIYRTFSPTGPGPRPVDPKVALKNADSVVIENKCPNCGDVDKFFLKFKTIPHPEPGLKDFPKSDQYKCKNCGANIDLSKQRLDMEKLTEKKAIF